MKKTVFLLLSIVACTSMAFSQGGSLMPIPKSVETGNTKFVIDQDFTLALDGEMGDFVYDRADDFLRRLAGRTGIFIKQGRIRKEVKNPQNSLMTIKVKEAGILCLEMDESYSLAINKQGIKLDAKTSYGAIRGLETLLQWLSNDHENYYFQEVKISDEPRFPWRGILIDPARHWLPADVIKRNIDGMAMVKMNVLHLHLTEDQGFRIESKTFPKLHEMGGEGMYYTQVQMKDIIKYAADRGIRVVPEFDIPGHATSWLVGHPELASVEGEYSIEREWGIMDPVLDPTKDTTYQILEGFLTEMSELFPDDYMHIGGDENNGKHWKNSEHIQKFMKENDLKDNHELQAYFNQKVLAILTKNNKQMVGWDEIQHPQMPKNVVIQSWRGTKGLIAAAKAGYQVMLSNGYYIDLIQTAAFHYMNDPLPEGHGLTTSEANLVMGGEATMWGEQVTHETIDSRIWPRTAVIAERLWSEAKHKDIESMYKRMEVINLQLEEVGLCHEKNYEMMLRRLCHGEGVEALRTLSDIAEPVKIYKRNALSTVNALMPYTRFVDATRPDAQVARNFNTAIDRILSKPNNIDIKHIENMLIEWYSNNQNLELILADNPVLHEIQPMAKNLQSISFIGLKALNYMKTGKKTTPEWQEFALETCKEAQKPYGETELMVVSGIIKLIESTK